MVEHTFDCTCGGTALESYLGAKQLLQMFIRCKMDGPYDNANPWEEKCEGCAYEREEILNHMWHYGEAVKHGDN